VIKPARKQTAVPEVEVAYEFGFDAAHRFGRVPRGHKYRGVHGHSFRVEIALRGTPRPPHGFVADLEKIERACAALRRQLDHKLLNEIKYLSNPSLENLALWIWRRLAPTFAGLARVTVRRDSLGQSATYLGPR
jgi:6-pyruvoyltetrahydropterin/6-carboxytetrahydropterin synthase